MSLIVYLPGGQFRKETILPNGTVTGAYSWKDVRGRIRLYTYTADKSGYRVTQHAVKKITDNHEISDNHIGSEVVKNDLINDDLYEDEDVRSGRNSKQLRLRRKVLVKRHRDKPVKFGRRNKGLRIKKLGLAAETIPYQQTLLLRYV